MMVVNDVLTATDNKAPSVLLSLDISMLDHCRLLECSRELFGLNEVDLEWLASVLFN